MLAAFLRACLADRCAHAAELGREFAAPGHEGGREPADGGAIDVERDAAGHHRHVLLLQTSRRATIAGVGASIACVDASLVGWVVHEFLLQARRSAPTRAGVPMEALM